jgi:hypothetical protein
LFYCHFPLLHFCASHFLYFSSLCPRIVSLDIYASHDFYSSFLITHSFYFISVHDSSLIFLSTPRIPSFDSHACHVSYSSVLIVHSFNFISVHDNSLILLYT